jgi:hypothetical protein
MANFPAFVNAGNVPEKVINELFNIAPTEVLFTQKIEQDTQASGKHEFLEETLHTPDKDNARIDGADNTDDSTNQGTRKYSWCQLTGRGITLGSQAESSDGFGNITKFGRQLRNRTNETRRDREASYLSENPSVEGVEDSVAGKSAGFFAWVNSNTSFGTGAGADGGWNSGTGIVDAPTPGTTRALSEANISTVHQDAFTAGGNVDCFFMIPALKTQWTNFMFTSSARIGAIYTPTQSGGDGATAIGSIQMYESNWGAVEVKANRIMQPEVATTGSTRTNFALVDSTMWMNSIQFDVRAERLAKTGHANKWLVESSWTLLALNQEASAAVRDIDYELAMVA